MLEITDKIGVKAKTVFQKQFTEESNKEYYSMLQVIPKIITQDKK